jgi:Cu/Ag efflux pump CusA
MANNKIKVQWTFDITVDEELQARLGLTEGEVYDELEEEGGDEKLNQMCADEMGVPVFVDLDLFFEDPRNVDVDQITDALSDEYGWLIDSYEWLDL